MSELQQFYLERKNRLNDLKVDDNFQALSHQWRSDAMSKKFVYNFDWLGRPIIQFPNDIMAHQQLIWDVQPDLIIETGIAHGGSLILSASLLALLDLQDKKLGRREVRRKVVGIDIDIRDHNRALIEQHFLSDYIHMIQGSSVDETVVTEVQKIAGGFEKVLVCLDSMHTHEHVLSELQAYAQLVSVDSYCIVYDTFVEDLDKGFFNDRPWDVGNNPKTAVTDFLKNNKEFTIDKDIEAKTMITVAPDGFLKRVK